jgi:hypothetical protein
MASVKLQGNASGTGSLTVLAPNTNSNLTLTLPASNGALVTTGDVNTVTNTMLARTGTAGQVLTSNGTGADPAYANTVTSAVAGNGITVSSATGAVTIALDFYTGTTPQNTSYPVGSYLMMEYTTAALMNATTTVYIRNATCAYIVQYNNAAGSVAVSGTWRTRGVGLYPNVILIQRVS